MKSLKEVLSSDVSRFTKPDIVGLLTDLYTSIGEEAFSAVTGIDVKNELSGLKKNEMIAVVHSFRDAYNPRWEANILRGGTEILGKLLDVVAADAALFSAQANTAATADFAAELGSIDFENLIGGPMDAAVSAQNNASISTVNFIKEVGFDRNEAGEVTGLKMADFSFSREEDNPEFDPANPNAAPAKITKDIKIQVPFISILNVPSLRIETLDIDFNVKLNSTYKRNDSSQFGINAGVTAGWGPVKMKVSTSYKRTSSSGVKVEKEYSMNVKVKATNDELPAGLEKVLGLMTS